MSRGCKAAEALVLCFPTWWYGMPAILKGYFDRVWANTVAFRLPEGGGAIRPALTNIKKIAVVTTYGAPWWFIRLVLPDPSRAVIMSGLGRLCGRGVAALAGAVQYRRRERGAARRLPRPRRARIRPVLNGTAPAVTAALRGSC